MTEAEQVDGRGTVRPRHTANRILRWRLGHCPALVGSLGPPYKEPLGGPIGDLMFAPCH